MNFESLLVAAIVIAAVLYLALRLRKKKSAGCGTGSCCGTAPKLPSRPRESVEPLESRTHF